jgi:hypothetical protein
MPNISNSDYIASIEESASVIGSEIGSETVDFVFRKFGANSVEDLNPADLSEVFSELYAIEADLR